MAEIPPQNSEHSTAPWVLASRELHMPKKPMDFELITRLADLRYETDGTNSINSSSQASLALSGPSVPLRSSAYSQSISNFELDHGGQPESLAPNANQMSELPPQNSEHSTAPWVLASRELHMPKKPMDVELIARLADLRRQADGTSSISSSSEASLALLGSSVSLASSALSQSISVMSSSPAVEFPPTPVFADTIPAGFMRELEPLSTRQTPQAPALNNPYYPLQNSHTLTATWSLDSFDTTQSLDSVNTIQLLDSVDTTHEVDTSASTSSSPTLSSPNSTPRQQPMQLPTPTNSIPHYTLNVADHTPGQTQIPTQTPSSNVTQQPSSLTSASTATPRTIKPLPAQASTHPPPSMISPEHNPPSPPNKENLKAWWNQFTLVKSPKGNPFKDPYRGPFILCSSYHKPTNQRARHSTPLITQSSGNLSRKACNTPASKYPQQMPMANSMSGATFLLSSQNGSSLFSSALCFFPPHLGPQWPLSQGKRSVLVSCAVQCFLFSPFVPPTATEIPGTFSISGSNRRMRDLQAAFESPPRVRSYITSSFTLLINYILCSVRQIPRLEERVLYYSRCSRRVPAIPSPDARQYLVHFWLPAGLNFRM